MTSEPPRERHPEIDDRLGEAWREHRGVALDVAYRMLGSITDAEDVVQEAFARLMRVDVDGDRRCPRMAGGGGDAAVPRPAPLGACPARGVRRPVAARAPRSSRRASGLDPADRVTLDDSVRMALLVVLERLSPAERAAFVLHDVFGFSFDAVGTIVGRSPAACRQLASRARRHIEAETSPARFEVDPGVLHRAAERFIRASSNGDIDALMEVLDPDVVGWTDTGGVVGAPREAVAGRLRVAKTFLGFLKGRRVTLRPMAVNGEPGAIAYADGKILAVLAFETRAGFITRDHAIANPEKLAYVRSRLEDRDGVG